MSTDLSQLSEKLRTASKTQILPLLIQCDAAGLLLAPFETIDQFVERLQKLQMELTKLSASDPAYAPLVKAALPLNFELTAQAQKLTRQLYGVALNWLPSYSSRRRTGFFSAGILYIIDDILPLVFLKSATAAPWGYAPDEVLAHEMIHAARLGFGASSYEEYFAWQSSRSPWRRTCGNFFRSWWRPALFGGGILAPGLELGLGGTLTWSVAGILLSFGLVAHEIKILRTLKRAREKLEAQGFASSSALLRLTDEEIRQIARNSARSIPDFLQQFWRGQIILQRFRFPQGERELRGELAVSAKFP